MLNKVCPGLAAKASEQGAPFQWGHREHHVPNTTLWGCGIHQSPEAAVIHQSSGLLLCLWHWAKNTPRSRAWESLQTPQPSTGFMGASVGAPPEQAHSLCLAVSQPGDTARIPRYIGSCLSPVRLATNKQGDGAAFSPGFSHGDALRGWGRESRGVCPPWEHRGD